MDPGDTNIYAYNIIDRYENRPDNSDDKYLAGFAASYIFEKADMNNEQEDEKSYINHNKVKKIFEKNEKKELDQLR